MKDKKRFEMLIIILTVLTFTPFIQGGCGGGGGGGGAPVVENSNTVQETVTDPDPVTQQNSDSPQFSGFDISLQEGDFWEYQWDYKKSFASAYSSSSSKDNGTFRIALGTAQEISGFTLYEVILTGKSITGNRDFAPRYKYIGISGNKILGSEDGTTLVTIFDAQTGAWPGGGFFNELSQNTLTTASKGTISNDYIQGDAVSTGMSFEQNNCQYFGSLGTICGGEKDENLRKREYFQAGIGPVGYYFYSGMSDWGSSDGGWSSSTTINVGLVASSLRGDPGDYDLETETNDSPESAQDVQLPAAIKGKGVSDPTYGDHEESTYLTFSIPEQEANDGPWNNQAVSVPDIVEGSVQTNDGASSQCLNINGKQICEFMEDWYSFTLPSDTRNVMITLTFETEKGTFESDLDLYLFNSDMSLYMGYSSDDNPAGQNAKEQIAVNLDAGTYKIAVDGFLMPSGAVNYTLDIDINNENENNKITIEDWYRFSLTEETEVTITLDIDDPELKDLDLYLFQDSTDNLLDSSVKDNPALSDPSESLTMILGPGIYYAGVDAVNSSASYQLAIQ